MQIASVDAEQLFVDFLNLGWYDGNGRFEDRLLDKAWRADFLRQWGFGDPGEPSRATTRRLQRLRGSIRWIVEEILAGRSPSARRLEAHAAELPAVPMRLEIAGGPRAPTWRTLSPSWVYVEAEVIRSCLEFLDGPARLRLRRCQNEGCLWAFVDASRNGSRLWCDPEICGNVAKVRAYRQRKKAR